MYSIIGYILIVAAVFYVCIRLRADFSDIVELLIDIFKGD